MATATLPTAKPEFFLDQLAGNGPLELPDTLDIEVEINGRMAPRTYKVRTETIKGLISTANIFAKHRVKELESLLQLYSNRKFGRTEPTMGETRTYTSNKAGYLQVNTKYIQQIEGTYHFDDRSPTGYSNHSRVNGEDKDYSTRIAVTYEPGRIILEVVPEEHRKKEEPSKAKKKVK